MTSLKFTKYSTCITVQIWAAKCVTKEGILNTFISTLKAILFCRFKVVLGKNIRQQTCCLYVLSYSSQLPF